MATTLHRAGKGPVRSYAYKALSYGEKIVKIGPLYPEIFGWICQFLPCRHESLQMSPVNSGFRAFLDYARKTTWCMDVITVQNLVAINAVVSIR